MKPDLMAQLPRSQREAVESAGYRVVRWVAARRVLQSRITKKRVAGPLGEFLEQWLTLAPTIEGGTELKLSFAHGNAGLKLAGGTASLAGAPVERALLHLPALRAFWRQELRLRHFEALRVMVPQAWLLDPAPVPPGAVIAGLGTTTWEAAPAALAARDSILNSSPLTDVLFHASYERNNQGQVVLRTIEEAAP